MASDDLGLFEDEPDKPARSRKAGKDTAGRSSKERRPPKRRSKGKLWLSLLVAAAIVGAGVWFGALQLLGIGAYEDFKGEGESDVVVQVGQGESVSRFGKRLVDSGVIASVKALSVAAETNNKVEATQAGYYLMKTKMSGAAAANRLVQKESRVGALEIKGGFQLEDILHPNGTPIPGILSLIAKASCADVNGKSTCVTPEALIDTMGKADPAALGVPDWAAADVAKVEPKRRLEGLIIPGRYDVKPGSTPEELLKSVVDVSSQRMQAGGMPKMSFDSGFRPYEILVLASLIEREAKTKDFGKVSRVFYNRFKADMPLQSDATVNYVKRQPTARTEEADRKAGGPYSYEIHGLPPTPIGAPSVDAFKAAVTPEAGPWVYFVKCQKDGTTCFNETFEAHRKDSADARARGAY